MNRDILQLIFVFCDIDTKINMTKAFPEMVFVYGRVQSNIQRVPGFEFSYITIDMYEWMWGGKYRCVEYKEHGIVKRNIFYLPKHAMRMGLNAERANIFIGEYDLSTC